MHALSVRHPVKEIGFTDGGGHNALILQVTGDSDHAGLIHLTRVQSLYPQSLKSEIAEMKHKVLRSWWRGIRACFLNADVSFGNSNWFLPVLCISSFIIDKLEERQV